ncbi:hypothetical protein HDV57DRAFT_504332 [Trichoderma longibrachiatum]
MLRLEVQLEMLQEEMDRVEEELELLDAQLVVLDEMRRAEVWKRKTTAEVGRRLAKGLAGLKK